MVTWMWVVPVVVGEIVGEGLRRVICRQRARRRQQELAAWKPSPLVQKFADFDPELRDRTAERRKRASHLAQKAAHVAAGGHVDRRRVVEPVEDERRLKVVGKIGR